MVLLRERKSRLVGFIEPCLPSPAKVPPSGPDWIHEIKHDGFRIMARRDAAGVRLITRKGNDLTRRFPFIAMAVAALPVASCLIDGEAIVSDDNGLAIFDRIRGHGTLGNATLCAFDLLQVDGRDLRREPLEARKRALAKLLRHSHSSVVVNEHFEGDGAVVFREACRLGCEGIVIEATWLTIPLRSHSALDQGQESEGSSGHTRSQGRMAMSPTSDSSVQSL
jgi:bifunctional non-homologous end joining protein LigD